MFRYSGSLVFFLALLSPHYGYGGDKEHGEYVGDKEQGEARYNESCISCHGRAGKGASSYPKVSGNEIAFTVEKLKAYREGIKQGPNSALMIMMARPLTDEEIEDLAVYLEDATYEVQ